MNDFAITGSLDLVLAKFRSSENKKWKIIRSEIQSLLNEILVDYFRLTNYNRIYDNVQKNSQSLGNDNGIDLARR